ncbi:MAG: 3-methyl-2-oxobutanoate hydroxymethyltransferase [Gammaproteobacteria bacterium]|nr:3-methyl-2-oxobutanoate hydroxymethyltransferase [Gammaproteobacteria bacterium]
MNTIAKLIEKKVAGEKLTCLTAYDASFAALLNDAGIEIILVGDSLGMVVQGKETTLPVTLDEIIYHASAVKRGAPDAFIVVDLPFMTYSTPVQALKNAGKVMKRSGANMVKLEGGDTMLETVSLLTSHGVPVCAHVGLLPQSVHKIGGYRVQGKTNKEATRILEDAVALEVAGADLIVLECVPAGLAKEISLQLTIPTIGIGAGVDCDGQVLVLYDMLNITKGKRPRFSKDFLSAQGAGQSSILNAVKSYIDAVKTGAFPGQEHSF